jgi:hypothetical protein
MNDCQNQPSLIVMQKTPLKMLAFISGNQFDQCHQVRQEVYLIL